MSLPRTVCRRCATTTTVAADKATAKTFCIFASVAASMFAVASSSKHTGDCLRMARQRQRSCLSPTDKLVPASSIPASKSGLPSSCSTKVAKRSLILQTSSAFNIAASEYSLSGSKLIRKVPRQRYGSCGITATCRRKAFPLNVWMSVPSILIHPDSGSTNRNNDCISVLLPQPDLPTTPSFVPPGTAKETSLRTSGKPLR
mmetsp:Transcript_4582/g.6476  ORF Transcript_4582/g.6476 Transcript_4582/m.6476 type:complete len:201 (-) Transcript_4582:1407-2009(-)